MTPASGLRLGTSGSELESRVAEPLPVQLAGLAGGGGDEGDAVRAQRRRLRWQIACAVGLALAIASFAIVIKSSVYEARASVLIRPPGGESGVPQAVGGALQSEVEILQSFDVLRQALESIGVGVLYPDVDGATPGALRAAAVARMRDALGVRTLPDSDVIEVTFRHADPQLAADAVNRLVERFRRSRRAALAPAASKRFLLERIEEQREALASAEASLAGFHAEHPGLAAPDPHGSLAERRSVLEAELRSQRDAIDAARAVGSSEDPSLVRTGTRLDELELELRATLNTHVEGSRAVSKLRSEIQRVRDYLAERERGAAKERGRSLELQRSRLLELEAQLVELGQAQRELPELERRERELVRERDVAARRLDAYQRELEAVTLAADVDEHAVEVAARVLESAQPPTARMIPEERAQQAWTLVGVALLVLLGAFVTDVLEQRERGRAHRQPLVFTAHVGTGAAGGSLALMMPGAEEHRRGGPVVLLLRGPSEGAADEAPGSGSRS